MFRARQVACLISLLAILTPFGHIHAQAKGKRLILKDGSYQIAREWELKGERVRFFSNERYEWEELPSSLIDWPDTEKFETARAAGQVAEAQQDAEQAEADRKADEEQTPTIAPGLRLPATGGIFL